MGCACLPWRDCVGFDEPQPCHPWQAVHPSGSCASRRLRRPGLTPGKPFTPREALLLRHSPLEGESARQGRQPAGAPVGGGAGTAPSRRADASPLSASNRAFCCEGWVLLVCYAGLVGFECWFGWGVLGWFDGLCMPSLARLCRLRLAPALPSMASRSPLRKLRFLSAYADRGSPMASRSPLGKLCFPPAAPAGVHPFFISFSSCSR